MTKMKTWKCEVCGYIHQGEEPPETCPICGVDREMFSLMEAVSVTAAPEGSSVWRCTICDYVHQGEKPPAKCPICGAEASLFEPKKVKSVEETDSMAGKQIVILGAGIAGLTAAENARFTSPDADITLVSKESGLPYYRLNLTRYLASEVPEEGLIMQPESWFSEKKIVLLENEAKKIDRQQKRLIMLDKQELSYDRLILANGSHPFVPPIPGITRDGVAVLRTVNNARKILQLARSGASCICIGGGLLGLETSGALSRQGVEVTVLEGFKWLLPRQLTEPAGLLLQDHVEKLGLTVRCGVQVKEIVGDEGVSGVRLTDGTEIQADFVILAAGVRPNSYLARQCQLKVKNGVLVDDLMSTSDPNIFAAGDVAEHRGLLYGIWPASYSQGMVAGINAAGGYAEFQGIPPSNRLKVLDVDVFSIGQIQANDASIQFYEEKTAETYQCLLCRDGRLIGANLYGDTSLAGPIKEAIENSIQIPELSEILEKFPSLADMYKRTYGS
ncbi:FAD-dependent oxidoreductase [candidate division CSSED10-310 bacterium]|uniref:FAD-dependent oxidoreductase n=1 Tax=candidate division CSSED10-310 bacterium TaxID=2855610 RepID=A0ABV6YUV7_UNCC1